MREIKFRAIMDGAIDVFNGWVYGNIMHITETYKGEEDTQEVDLWYIITNDGVQLPIKKDTIGQYTGLKDKNGKEIYEGDIVSEKSLYHRVNKKIQWKESYSCWLRGEWQRLTPKNIKEYDIEVIGNIYDNPDLIKE